MGSSTAPTVSDSGRPSITETGVRTARPRPRNRARSVSYWTIPLGSSSTVATCAAQICRSSPDRGRRVASSAPELGHELRLHEQVLERRMRDIRGLRSQHELGI